MQKSIQRLTSSLHSNQALQASALVGLKVLVSSNILNLGQEEGVKAAIDVPAGEVQHLRAAIYSQSGDLMRIISLGQQNPGLFEFIWDGSNDKGERVPVGNYSLKVNAICDGQEVTLKTMTAANVDSVCLGVNGEGVKLNVAGIGSVFLNEVKQITG
ncbi:flagellar basal-body rod modification protein FlgD [Legionella lansingensis]|uniref:Flagellar basal body rod modification protein n=1 Tax=Legionella lansingensis TaxID=45067 RepID=A0A0W0VTP7_9GAMM|nr:FlgD immunoglobulin-like domain containing protein [Legionella lansingensis]KTD23365.1 flagellar basal body rod modification protein [Legionella lansingensis]SNV49406.1 flagellar basal-body rod modification protein FlgD [Legionella lansingensis]